MDGSPATEIGERIDAGTRALMAWARARPVATAALATALVSLVALMVPGLDLAVAGLFLGVDGGFPASRMPALIELRAAGMAVTRIAVGIKGDAVVRASQAAPPCRGAMVGPWPRVPSGSSTSNRYSRTSRMVYW